MTGNKFLPEIKGNLGFGCMRLPMKGDQVDYEAFCTMTDRFLEAGFNYFDTAHAYIDGLSETAIRDCVVARHPRDSFLLADKLTAEFFKEEADIRPFFEKQLELCGVDFFDFYLMHAQESRTYPKFQACNAYKIASELKAEGKIRHLGISFHDKPHLLEKILTEHPEIEIVQIQLNYIDYEDPSVESRAVYEVCEKFGKPVLVMEPVKGGSLVNLPEEADRVLKDLGGGSNASYAIRFAAGFPNIAAVLSGMSTPEQMEDNLKTMSPFVPLSEKEMEAIEKVREVFRGLNLIPCTTCRYCITESECPKAILIPDIFAAYNSRAIFRGWNAKFYYVTTIAANGHGRAADCIGCGKCEKVCPQHLEIRKLLETVAESFDRKKRK